jgi:hypothetical protein
VFDVYLLNLQFRAAGVYSIHVFCSGRLLIVGCHTYQSAGIQCAVTERLACFNFPIISLHSSRRKYSYDEYVTSAYTRLSLLLPRLSPFHLRQKCQCSMSEGRSIAKWHIWRGFDAWCVGRHKNWFPAACVVLAVFSASCCGQEAGTWVLCLVAKCSAWFELPSLSFEVTLPAKLVFCWEFIVNLTAFHVSFGRRWGNDLISR